MPREEVAPHRPARPAAMQPHLGDEHVGRAILIEQHPPPAAPAPQRQPGVQHQRIGTVADRADIVDRGGPGMEACPGALPLRAPLEHLERAARGFDWDHEHRRRAHDLPAGAAQVAARTSPIEQHAQPRDVARRPDLLVVDLDAGDDRIERRIGQARRLAEGDAADAREQHLPRLALRLAPAAHPRRVRALRRDVDIDVGHLEIGRAVDRRHAALARRELRADHSPPGERDRDDTDADARPQQAKAGAVARGACDHGGLVASWPWKSKRDVASAEPW